MRVHALERFISVALCAFSVSSVSGMDRSRKLCVAMSPYIARVLFDTEHTEKAQRATEFKNEPLERLGVARDSAKVLCTLIPAFSRTREKEPINRSLGTPRRLVAPEHGSIKCRAP